MLAALRILLNPRESIHLLFRRPLPVDTKAASQIQAGPKACPFRSILLGTRHQEGIRPSKR
jgi:hypothetical protein